MERHRDMTRTDTNHAIDNHRQRDSGLKGQRHWKSQWMEKHLGPPPTTQSILRGADRLEKGIQSYAPPGISNLATAGIEGFKFGFKHTAQ